MILEENTVILKDKKYVTLSYDNMDDLFSILDNVEYSSFCYYPSMEEVEIMKTNLPKYYAFILWILSNPVGPETKEEEKVEKELNRIIMKYTRLKRHKTGSNEK